MYVNSLIVPDGIYKVHQITMNNILFSNKIQVANTKSWPQGLHVQIKVAWSPGTTE